MKDIKVLADQLNSWEIILQNNTFGMVDASVFKVTAEELIKEINEVKDYIQTYIEIRTK